MNKVVVTGGAGFIGSHIVDMLKGVGLEVSALDNLSSGKKENLPSDVPLYVHDIRSAEARELLAREQPDILVHAAAQISVRKSMDDPAFDADVNIVGLSNLLQAFQGKTFPFVVFISTGGAIYGEQEAFPAKEDHRIQPASFYGLSKRVCEQYLDFWGRELGLSYGVLRLANVYGPRQNPHGEAGVVAIFSERTLQKEPCTIYGTGKQTRDFVYVKNVADAVRRMVADRVTGVYNIGTGRETDVNELYKMIATSAGSPLPPEYAPGKPGEQLRSVIDASLATATFGWTPSTAIEQGLKETVEWFGKKA